MKKKLKGKMMPKKNVKKMTNEDGVAEDGYGYPNPIEHEIGNKVEFRTYAFLKLAEEAARFAKREAEFMRSQGYDFGYCCPGSIHEHKTESGNVVFRVTCP